MTDDPTIYWIDPATGKARTTAGGEKMKLSYFDDDPTDDVPEPSDEQVDADIEMLGLSEYLPDDEDEKEK